MTKVPGPRQTIYLAGKPLRGIMFWVPSPARLGLGVSILSYAGEVRVGIQTDAGLVPDPHTIVAGFHAELDELLELARAVEATGKGGDTAARGGAAGPLRCQALTRAGTRCKNPARPGTAFCRVHAG